MTTTVENAFGSRLMTNGFLLNNELTDFSFASQEDGVPIANRVEPGKRPRSSMSPTIVMKDGRPVMAVGSPGGSMIIGFVAQAIIAHIDWGFDARRMVSMPHVVDRFGPVELESGTDAEKLAGPLAGMGFRTVAKPMNSGLQAIVITPEGLRGRCRSAARRSGCRRLRPKSQRVRDGTFMIFQGAGCRRVTQGGARRQPAPRQERSSQWPSSGQFSWVLVAVFAGLLAWTILTGMPAWTRPPDRSASHSR